MDFYSIPGWKISFSSWQRAMGGRIYDDCLGGLDFQPFRPPTCRAAQSVLGERMRAGERRDACRRYRFLCYFSLAMPLRRPPPIWHEPLVS